ncbi:MAG: hypothetical protein K0S60_652 [Evtepia sp.]|nr:hypothetical protein [Evtepia sp.]
MANVEENLARKQAHEKLLDELKDVAGSQCEMRSMNNILICLGRVQSLQGESLTIVSNTGLDMPKTIYNTLYKIIIRKPGETTLVFCGQICGSTRSFWKLDRLELLQFKENRAYFRQPVSGQAYVVCINDLLKTDAQKEEVKKAKFCRVLDISLEGIQVWVREANFKVGDWLLLVDVLLSPDDNRLHKFICQVCRTIEDGRGGHLIGCRIELMNEWEQNSLCSDIFSLQRKDIQAGRLM